MLIAKKMNIVINILEEIMDKQQKIRLRINKSKTKIMKIGKALRRKLIKVEKDEFGEVDKFSYPAMEVEQKNIYANRILQVNKKLPKKRQRKRIRIAKRKIMRKILGSTRTTDGEYRI